jgi:hypothetical protein
MKGGGTCGGVIKEGLSIFADLNARDKIRRVTVARARAEL